MLTEEQKKRRRERKRDRYANDPEFREKQKQSVRVWQEANPRDRSGYFREWQRKKREDPEVRARQAAYMKARRASNPAKAREISNKSKAKARTERPHLSRDQWLWWAYRMRPEEYDAKLVVQNFLCAICSGDNNGKRLLVDHDHAKPKGEGNRWLLCNACNVMLGAARENPEYLRKAATMLEAYNGA